MTSAISRPYELWRHDQFTLGLLNRLLEVAKRDNLPLEQVKQFYRTYEKLVITTNDDGALFRLISNVLRDKSPEAQTARKAWREPEPTAEDTRGLNMPSVPPPTSFAVIAGLFRNLERLGMHQEAANFAQFIVTRIYEIKPIYMATLWLPCLRVLQDLVEPDVPAYQSLFQTIFERYGKLVLDDSSLRPQKEPETISPMTTCCRHCKYLNPFFEQPKWKTFHVVKPKHLLEHVQGQLRKQQKPVEVKIYGKSEASLTMQLTKASLVNKELIKIRSLRGEEASKMVRTFDPLRLQEFLGDKADIMWRLANAADQDQAGEKTPARSTESPFAGSTGLSRTSPASPATPLIDTRDSTAERASAVKSETPSTTPNVDLGHVKAEPSSSATRTVYGTRSIRDMFASVKKEKTPASSHSAGLSTRDRLKTMGSVRRESAPKLSDPPRPMDPFRRTPSKAPKPTVPGSSSRAPVPPVKRDPLASFGGVRSKEPVRSGVRTAGSSSTRLSHASATGSSIGSTPSTMRGFGLASRSSAAAAPSSTPRADSLSATPSTHPNGSKAPDFVSAVLEAEKARKKRSNGSTWEVRTAAGSVVGSGTSSSAMAKSRFDGLATNKENSRLSKSSSTGLSQASRGATALASRSPNVGMNGRAATATSTTTQKRKMVDYDDDIIDLCGSSPEPVGGKRKKTTAVFNHLDDDPFGE